MKSAKNRAVLGINAYSHDAGAALVLDGRVVFAAEQERYDRIKHSAAFPRDAIRAALGFAGIEPGDVDAVAFCWSRGMARWRKAAYVAARLPRSLPFLTQKPEGLPKRVQYLRSIRRLRRDLLDLGVEAPVRYVEHHRAHAEQAWRFGPGDDAALITADGMGEWTATATWSADAAGVRQRRTRSYPHSLGKVYAAVTQHLGFRPDSGEGKTMGLAAYGRDTLVPRFRDLLAPDDEDLYRVALREWAYPRGHTAMAGPRFVERFGPPRAPDAPVAPAHEDLAFAVQAVVEEVILGVAQRLRRDTGARHLGLAGGLFLNCALNGRLRREAGFDSVSCFPAAGDAGAAAGAAALVAGSVRAPLEHAFLGDGWTTDEIDAATRGRPVEVVTDPAAWAAAALAEGRVIGWFQERMEFGPRALGARSILADPRDAAARDRINETVKFREPFRPLAPAALAEEADRWFHADAPSPFMLFAVRARDRARDDAPAAVHVDGTARLQTVASGPLRPVLERFHERTGVPILINTSLNVRGQPIARTPADALAVLDDSALDALVLHDRVVSKPLR